MKTEPFIFAGAGGAQLVGRLERPDGALRAYALFAHCFTCGKDSSASVRVSRALAERGIATLRFDFAGIGASGGSFAETTFTSNVDDLVAAADALRVRFQAPALLIGHSLGGAAVIAAASRIPEARAVVTIGAPADAAHVAHHFSEAVAAIQAHGAADVTLGGRSLTIGRAFVDDIAMQPQRDRIAALRRALLVLHAPQDAVVGVDNASAIFLAARHPKSFISLDDADHFLSRPSDAAYAAGVIAGWAERYLPAPAEASALAAGDGWVSVGETGDGQFRNEVQVGRHRFLAGEPVALGGDDAGPTPYDLLAASLGACKSITVRMYADQKGWPLARVGARVRHNKIHAADCADCETSAGKIDEFRVEMSFEGALSPEQRARLMEIADKCPVHRTLHAEVKVRSSLAAGDGE